MITTDPVRRRLRSLQSDEFAKITADLETKPAFTDYRVAAERLQRIGKARIVRAGVSSGIPYLLRLHPIRFGRREIPRTPGYWRRRSAAADFLHASICTEADRRGAAEFLEACFGERFRGGHVCVADLELGSPRQLHASEDCADVAWVSLAKTYWRLNDELDAAAGRNPDLAQFQPWRGGFLVCEFRRSQRRGRPALKQPFYRLATDYVEAARAGNGRLPARFFPTLALHLSWPWYGITFSANELLRVTQAKPLLSLAESSSRL